MSTNQTPPELSGQKIGGLHHCTFANCNVSEKMKWRLTDHILANHYVSRPYPCAAKNCDRGFSSKQRLQGHIVRVHGEGRRGKQEVARLLKKVSQGRTFQVWPHIQVFYGEPEEGEVIESSDIRPPPPMMPHVLAGPAGQTGTDVYGGDEEGFLGGEQEQDDEGEMSEERRFEIFKEKEEKYWSMLHSEEDKSDDHVDIDSVQDYNSIPRIGNIDSFSPDEQRQLAILLTAENRRMSEEHLEIGERWNRENMVWAPVDQELPEQIASIPPQAHITPQLPQMMFCTPPIYTIAGSQPQFTFSSIGNSVRETFGCEYDAYPSSSKRDTSQTGSEDDVEMGETGDVGTGKDQDHEMTDADSDQGSSQVIAYHSQEKLHSLFPIPPQQSPLFARY